MKINTLKCFDMALLNYAFHSKGEAVRWAAYGVTLNLGFPAVDFTKLFLT